MQNWKLYKIISSVSISNYQKVIKTLLQLLFPGDSPIIALVYFCLAVLKSVKLSKAVWMQAFCSLLFANTALFTNEVQSQRGLKRIGSSHILLHCYNNVSLLWTYIPNTKRLSFNHTRFPWSLRLLRRYKLFTLQWLRGTQRRSPPK